LYCDHENKKWCSLTIKNLIFNEENLHLLLSLIPNSFFVNQSNFFLNKHTNTSYFIISFTKSIIRFYKYIEVLGKNYLTLILFLIIKLRIANVLITNVFEYVTRDGKDIRITCDTTTTSIAKENVRIAEQMLSISICLHLIIILE
jgi:hypothetical protein